MIILGYQKKMIHYFSPPSFKKNLHVYHNVIEMLRDSSPLLFVKISLSSFLDCLTIEATMFRCSGLGQFFWCGVSLIFRSENKKVEPFANIAFCSALEKLLHRLSHLLSNKPATTYFWNCPSLFPSFILEKILLFYSIDCLTIVLRVRRVAALQLPSQIWRGCTFVNLRLMTGSSRSYFPGARNWKS
jgi:hypothetical protein